MFSTFFTGLTLGLAIAAPVGPIGILCIRRTLAMGRWVGLVSGLGAATADGVYGCIAGFGLTAVADFLTEQVVGLRVFGGLFLCYLGVKTLLAKPAEPAAASSENSQAGALSEVEIAATGPRSLLTAYGSTLLLTLTNPATIFSFAAIFAGLGIVESASDYGTSGILVLGVFCGSALWWLLLSGTVSLLRTRLTTSHMRWLNRLSGIILLVFGIVALTVWPRNG
ncbi:MAG: LysE family transporter [Cyanobacteria bacterium P01_A01_bin.70]